MTNYTDRLKSYWKTESLSFIAVFKRFKQKEGFFNDLINPISLKKLRYPELEDVKVNNKNVSFYVPDASNLIDGHYYKIDLAFANSLNRKNNPYSLQISSVANLNQDEVKSHLSGKVNENLLKNIFQIKSFVEKEKAKHHIKQRFERRTKDPDGNKIIANLMLEIGAGMYSSKQRMIFELLQNADDAPGKEKVEFHIDVNGDYFFVMHDGSPFNKDDINAITSAAQSTKKKNKKKTGYKGIGFKSVFTNSTEVWLKSDGYRFAFLRNSPLFKNFDDFYFSSDRYKKHPEFIEEDKMLYTEQREHFDSTTDIPWQIIPIWQESLPNEFTDSNFNNFNNPVQFALKVGTNNIYSEDGFLNAVDNIVKKPQFLLFLRNTSKFRSPKNRVTVTRKDVGNIIEIEKTIVEYVGEKRIHHTSNYDYVKISFPDIVISNESFSKYNIDLKKSTKVINKKEVYEFVDLSNELIETIPPKLASVDETEISFGIRFSNNKINVEGGYSDNSYEYSSLYTYLPMEDKRFKLPFLVNADFIPDSRRESLQGDNPWNKYIMIKVAEKHVATLAHFAQAFLKDKDTNSSYLSLLLKNPLPEDDTAQQIIESYNTKYLEQLENTEIVINDNDQIQLLSDTIIDNSGLIELFGNEIFYEIIDTEKRLPNSNLDAKYLKDYDYLEVEVIDLEEIAEQITPELCESLGTIIAQKTLFEKPELLKWLNKLAKYLPDDFGKIPFIQHNTSPFSLERLIDEDDAWLINAHTSQYETILGELGYHTIQLNLDKYSNIKDYLHSFTGYINDKTLAYERIASNPNIHKLPVTSKLKLIDFFQNSAFMVGIGETKYFGELKLFIDESDNPRPIWDLLNRNEDIEVNSINEFRIKKTEFNSFTDDLQKQLIAKEEIFTSFILDEDLFKEWSQQFETNNINTYVSDLKTMYSWIDNPDDISSAQWASISWLYIDDEVRFETSDKVYWSKAFNDLSADNFEIIKSIFHTAELKTLPVQECGALIKAFPIKTDDNIEIDWSAVKKLEIIVANTLLDWMEDDGGFGDFFKNYWLKIKNNYKYKIKEIEDIQIFDGSNKELTTYIQSSTELSSMFKEMDKNLCNENRSMIGLLQGDRLIKAIIKSSEYDQNLALHLPSNVSTELLHSFIANLKEFTLSTSSDYGGDTPEHLIISRLLKNVESINEIPPELQNTIDILRSKTFINGNPLSNYTVSDYVSFGVKENKKVLKLSDILTEFQGESDVLEKVKESFTAITQKTKLRELIFKTIPLTKQKIHSKIEAEEKSYYTPYQFVFQLLDKFYGGNRNWSKDHFDDYFIELGKEKDLHSFYKKFLDILLELNFTDLSDFRFHNLILRNCVDKSFAIESEYIPNWLEEWTNKDKTKRPDFLTKLGFNGHDSPIVNFRKSMIAKNYDKNTVIRYFEESKPNRYIIGNTLFWLSKYSPKIITENIAVIKTINDYIKSKANNKEQIIIPLIKSINPQGQRTYHLQSINTEIELFQINFKLENAAPMFNSIRNNLDNPFFIDETIGGFAENLNITIVDFEELIDSEKLDFSSDPWDELYYKKWKHSNEYPIYIYNGNEIPYRLSFRNITIDTFNRDLKAYHDGKFYVSKVLKKDVLNNLPESFPEEMLSNLKDWHYKTLQNDALLDEDSFDYKEDIDRLLQNRLGISEEDQKRESGNTKTHAVYFLDENGYDVSNVNSAGAALTDIIDPDGNQVNCIVRSAKGGLLYLDKEHWDMMQDDFMHLIVIYPGNSPRLFKNRLELLEEDLAENVLFRVPNNKFTSEIDGVFNALESESHLILVTSEKMKESLFSKLKQKNEFNKEKNAAVGGEDFRF